MRTALIAASVAIALPASATPPADLVQTFVRLCGETGGEASAAAARAEAMGWKAPSIPLSVLAALVPGAATANLQARTAAQDGRLHILLAGTITAKGQSRRSCSVAERGGGAADGFSADRQALQAWTGVPAMAMHDDPGLVAFAFREGPHGREPAPAGYDPLADAATPNATVSTVVLSKVGSIVIVIYAPRASPERLDIQAPRP